MSFFANSNAASMPQPKVLGVDRKTTPTDEHGRPVPYLFGKTVVGVTFISEPWGFRSSPIVTKVGKQKQVTGYHYYCSFAAMLCLGPVDAIYEIRIDDQVVWSGDLERDVDDFEPLTIEGRGEIRFYWGTDDQAADSWLAASGTTHPAYRGQCYVVCSDFLLGDNAQTPALTFVVARYPDKDWLTAGANVDDNAHPIAVLADLLQSPRFGLGLPESRLDTATLNATAATLTTEGVGISGIIDTSQDWSGVLARILENFDGYVTVDSSGRFGVKLVRGEEGDGLTFNEDDLTEDPDIQTTAWPDTLNQVEVTFSNRDKDWQEDSVAWHDRANFEIVGETKTETLQRPWITTQEQAYQIAGGMVPGQRAPADLGDNPRQADSAAGIEPGDTFHLTFASSGISGLLCRAEDVTRDGPESPEVTIRFLEDRGYLNSADYVPADDTPVTPTTYGPEQIDGALLFEPPYPWFRELDTHFLMILARGDSYSDTRLAWNEVAPSSFEFYRGTSTFAIRVKLEGTLSADGAIVDESGGLDLSGVSPDTTPPDVTYDEAMRNRGLLFIGTEIIAVWGPTLVSASRYTWNYARSWLGCTRENHADQDEGFLVFASPDKPILSYEHGAVADDGDTLTWKFQMQFLGVQSDLSLADEYDGVATSRAYLPLAPINLTANGDGHCPTYSTGGDVVLDWDQSSPLRWTLPVEEDCTDDFADGLKIELRTTGGTLQDTITITSPMTGPYTLTNAVIQAAMGGETDFVVRLYNQRAGRDSMTYDTVTVSFV